MVQSFHSLLNGIAIASNERELRQRFMDAAGEINAEIGAELWIVQNSANHALTTTHYPLPTNNMQ